MYLIIKDRKDNLKSIPLDTETKTAWLIGRDASCDIIISSAQVSRRHAKLTYENNEFFIEDTGSTLGIFTDDVKITEKTSIASDAKIKLGSCEIYLSEDEARQDERHRRPPPRTG